MSDKKCPVYKKCNGCQLMNMSYDEQLRFKEIKCVRSLGKYGRVEKIVPMENPYFYRNKVQTLFRKDRHGNLFSGVYQSSTGGIVGVEKCLLENEKATEIISDIKKLIKKYRILVYNPANETGFLNHVLIRSGFRSGEIMVVLATRDSKFEQKNNFVKDLVALHPQITSVVQTVGKSEKLVLGKTQKVLFGKPYIEDILCGLRFKISANSFYQVNPVQTEKLYTKAIELASLKGNETVIDAYCGIGTIGLIASKKAKEVIAVENVKDAVMNAKENAKLNGIENVSFYCADASDFLKAYAEENKADVVFLDPPRMGSTPKFLYSVLKLNPKKIVYISCNPETQGRDLYTLVKGGYKVKKICPFDMFPQTNHVETVVSLVKLPPDDVINIELDLTKLDISINDGKPTYDQIKAYVLKKYGLKVSSLYISQIKRKHGLEVGESYNKSKKDNQHIPQCPKDKEDAITDALKYFKMI
ncbi:MAG: 23S rRNA (uracil(1939)-C(5))-methyltransferase RlmD [Ruminococcaceae bacterium]|nr:23S rRNA (uracil(1939)-C(5))-methyltransferase RlmD [Oscillospiraceae bacterium]